jgi:TonB family protein
MTPQVNRCSLISLILLFACLCFIFAPQVSGQETVRDERRRIDYTNEFDGRSWARKKVLPVYPAAAIAENIQGVVEVGVGITDEGRVIKVRVPPGLHPLLRKAAVAAVKQWQFKAWVNKMPPGGYCIFRLTFNFIIEEGAGRVELYDPEWNTPQDRRMRDAGPRSRTEWLSWEDATNDH